MGTPEFSLLLNSARPEQKEIPSAPTDRERPAIPARYRQPQQIARHACEPHARPPGEDLDDALTAVDRYLAGMEHEHSFVVTEGDRVVAMSFATVVDGVHYVDPIVVAADRKRIRAGP